MHRRTCLWLTGILLISLFLVLDGMAEARRVGGGKSFGSKPNYQRSYDKPTTPQRDSKQPAQNQPQQGPLQGSPSRGIFGGMGGMLGGMLMGGLIGSLLFGGMGGFRGPGLLDILIVGAGLFFLYRYLRSRRAATQAASPMPFDAHGPGEFAQGGEQRSGMGWGGMSSSASAAPAEALHIPPGFDEAEFMAGAKAAYNRLQESWDKRDLEDIRHFTSSEVWKEIKRQAEEDPIPGKTEIVLVKAQLLEVRTEGDETVASVHFDVLMRESAQEERAKQVREVWHFSRNESVPGSFWVLEGIQQLE